MKQITLYPLLLLAVFLFYAGGHPVATSPGPIAVLTDTVPGQAQAAAAAKQGQEALKKGEGEVAKIQGDAKKLEDSTKKLIDKFLGFFKFRANKDAHIRKVVRSTGVQDSIQATNTDIKLTQKNLSWLINQLADTSKQHTDSLFRLINALSDQSNNILKDIKTRDSIARIMDSIAKLPKVPSTGAVVPKTDAEKLATQIRAIVEKEKNQADQNNKDSILNQIHSVIAAYGKRNILKKGLGKNDTLETLYSLKVRPNKQVAFYYDLTDQGYMPPRQNLDFVSTIFVKNAFFILNNTGEVTESKNVENDPLLKDTEWRKEKKLALNLRYTTPDKSSFLLQKSVRADSLLINDLMTILSEKNLYLFSAVNLDLTALEDLSLSSSATLLLKKNLTQLINDLNRSMHHLKAGLRLYVTLPPDDRAGLFDLDALTNNIFYIIDFTASRSSLSEPLDPLKGLTASDNSITLGFTTYANKYKLPHNMYLLGLSYKGAQWRLTAGNAPDDFIGYVPYAFIINCMNTQSSEQQGAKSINIQPETVDETYANAYVNILNSSNRIITQLWYNNSATLGAKYDYVNGNTMGGVVLNALGDDSTRPELWDQLYYKFGRIDTLDKKVDSLVTDTLSPPTLWEKIKYTCYLYHYVLQNPCAVCFENIRDSAQRSTINFIIQKLGIDKLVYRSRSGQGHGRFSSLDPEEGYANTFEYVQDQMRFIFLLGSIIIGVLLLAILLFYLWKIKTFGDDWEGKRIVLGFLIGLPFILFIFLTGFSFVDNDVPYFGSHSVAQKMRTEKKKSLLKSIKSSKEKTIPVDSTAIYKDSVHYLKQQLDSIQNHISEEDSGMVQDSEDSLILKQDTLVEKEKQMQFIYDSSCIPDPQEKNNCVNMPFYSLILIAFIGLGLGYVITIFFVIPFINRETPVSKTK